MPTPSNKKKQNKRKFLVAEPLPPAKCLDRPSPSAAPNAVPSEPPAQPSGISFHDFITVAEFSDVMEFFRIASATSEGGNLLSIWERAFKEGQDRGYEMGESACAHKEYDKETEYAHKEYNRGYDEGFDEGLYIGMRKPILTTSAVQTDFEPTALTTSATQTDSLAALPAPTDLILEPTTDSAPAIPTHIPPNPPIDPPENIPSKSSATNAASPQLDWAEDVVVSPPMFKKSPPPRDLSILRSSISPPFSSLQRRKKRSSACGSQQKRPNHWRNFPAPEFTPKTPQCRSHAQTHQAKPATPPAVLAANDTLNWDIDPRLADLSRALTALGWIRKV